MTSALTHSVPGESLDLSGGLGLIPPPSGIIPGAIGATDAAAIERFPALYRGWNNIAANVRDADTRLMRVEGQANSLPAIRRAGFVASVLAPMRLAVKRAKDAELSLRRSINALQVRLMAAAEEAFRLGRIGPADVPGILWGQGLTRAAIAAGLVRPGGPTTGNAVPPAPVGNQNAPVGVDGLGVLPVVGVAVWTGAATITRAVATQLARTGAIRLGVALGIGTVALATAVGLVQTAISSAQTSAAQANNAVKIGEAAAARIAAGGSVPNLPPGVLPKNPGAPSGLFDRVGAGVQSALPLVALAAGAFFLLNRKGRK